MNGSVTLLKQLTSAVSQLDKVLPGLPGAVGSAVQSGISNGFNGLGHTVNLWLFAMPTVYLLVLVFGPNLSLLLSAATQWVAHQAPTPQPSTLWAPTAGLLGPHGLNWTAFWVLWTVLLWVWGVLMGAWRLMAGRGLAARSQALPAFLRPFGVGVAVWLLPLAIGLVEGRFLPGWAQAIQHAIAATIALPAGQTAWLTNPVWIWGAAWGISGPHGIDLAKIPGALAVPAIAGVVSGAAQAVTGHVSTWRAIANSLYGTVDFGIVIMVVQQSLLAVWTTLQLLVALWLSTSPLWVWIACLDPWDGDGLMALLGLTLRAALLQAGAWVWVAGLAVIGGGPNGPLGMAVPATLLAPILAMVWTALGCLVIWRGFAVPLWAVGRGLQRAVVQWWGDTRVTLLAPASAAGAWGQDTGQRWQAWGDRLQTWGVRLPGDLGAAVAAAGGRFAASGAVLEATGIRARQWGLHRQMAAAAAARAADPTVGEQARWSQSEAWVPAGQRDQAFWNPVGWARGHGAGAQSAVPPAQWTAFPDGHWEGIAVDAAGARQMAQTAQQALRRAGLASSYAEWLQQTAARQAEAEAADLTTEQGVPVANHPRWKDAVAAWKRQRTAQLVEWMAHRPEWSPETWARQWALPVITQDGARVTVQAPPGAQWSLQATAVMRQLAPADQPLTRRRGGMTETYRNGVWVIVPSPEPTTVPLPSRPIAQPPPPPPFDPGGAGGSAAGGGPAVFVFVRTDTPPGAPSPDASTGTTSTGDDAPVASPGRVEPPALPPGMHR